MVKIPVSLIPKRWEFFLRLQNAQESNLFTKKVIESVHIRSVFFVNVIL